MYDETTYIVYQQEQPTNVIIAIVIFAIVYFLSIGTRYMWQYSRVGTRSISICQLEKYGHKSKRRTESEEEYIISKQEQQHKTSAQLHEQAQRKQVGDISSYKEHENIRNKERAERRRIVLICDYETDLLSHSSAMEQQNQSIMARR